MGQSKYTDAKRIANNKWDAANIDHLGLALPRGYRECLKARASELGMSVNGYLKHIIDADLENTGKTDQTGIGCQDTPLPLGTTHGEN